MGLTSSPFTKRAPPSWLVFMVTFSPGAALASTPDSCFDGDACGEYGLCAPMEDGTCGAAADAHCPLSVVCREAGYCVAFGGGCEVPATDDVDCFVPRGGLGFSPCLDGGLCASVGGRCVAGVIADAECRWPGPVGRSPCEELGLCGARGGRCEAVREVDCREAWVCREMGLCRASRGRCVALGDADCAGAAVCRSRGACRAVGGRCEAVLEGCLGIPECRAQDMACEVVSGVCVWPGSVFDF
jgi:hypothetical protein